MRLTNILAIISMLVAANALAQPVDLQGLDLSDNPSKEQKKEEKPAVPPNETVDAAQKKPTDGKLTEVEIASEDRVKSVQRKLFIKRGRVELTPLGFATINDAYFAKYGVGARAAFFFQDSLGLALRFNQYNHTPSDNVRLAKRELQSRLPSVLPKTSYALDLLWSPIYGKMAFFNSIRTFDLYLTGGIDLLYTQTSDKDGPHLGGHVGIGERFAVLDFLAIDLSLLDTIYSDRPDAGSKSVAQHMISLNLGFSFFLPLSFEYKEP